MANTNSVTTNDAEGWMGFKFKELSAIDVNKSINVHKKSS